MRRVVLQVADVEAALDDLLPLLPDGVHERAGNVLVAHARTRDLPDLSPYGDILDDLEVPDDWQQRRRLDGLGGVAVAGRFWLRSPLDPPAAPGLVDIVIDRSSAFGTGAHPTTRMCLELMAGLQSAGAFADLGCGAGALAIAAAKLGFAPVHAVDYDGTSVEAARANATANGVLIEAEVADLTAQAPPAARVIAANMPGHVHAALQVPPDAETILVSGIRAEDDVTYAGWNRTSVLHAGGWVAMRLDRV